MKTEKVKVNDVQPHSVNVRFKGEDYEYLQEWAKEDCVTVSAIVRSEIMKVIKERKKKK